ncbi:Tn3 family transposase [Streptomyces sp. NPDC049687]|uniref:Tn3 family transposase n=1 Tax=Streptomyces sp. NPDC049687 TaxID=3365596 RepID=UPI003791E85F
MLHYGKDGALTGPDKEHAETSMLALHLLQAALVHVNTLLLQQVLAEPDWRRSSPARTGAGSRRCSGPTSTHTAPSAWRWTSGSTSRRFSQCPVPARRRTTTTRPWWSRGEPP